mgnify:CR=1 FL=1|jgi:hypothetical protein
MALAAHKTQLKNANLPDRPAALRASDLLVRVMNLLGARKEQGATILASRALGYPEKYASSKFTLLFLPSFTNDLFHLMAEDVKYQEQADLLTPPKKLRCGQKNLQLRMTQCVLCGSLEDCACQRKVSASVCR